MENSQNKKASNVNTKTNKWSEAERQIVRDGYRNADPVDLIAKRINRTIGAVVSRASQMGLSHPRARYVRTEENAKERVMQVTLPYIPPPRFSA